MLRILQNIFPVVSIVLLSQLFIIFIALPGLCQVHFNNIESRFDTNH